MKMADLSHYDTAGRIIGTLTVPESMIDLQIDGVVYGRADPATEYVVDRTITPRPVCPAVLDGLTLSGVPVPSTLIINGQPFEVSSEVVDLEFPHPGSYALRMVKWPYLDGVFEVNV